MATTLQPTTDLVVQTWLLTLAGITNAGPTLPQDVTTWTAGFVQVTTVGGSPDVDLPIARPVVQLDFWAVSPTSAKPPWGKANSLAEAVRTAMYDPTTFETVLTLPGNYAPARIMAAYLATEPRRLYEPTQDTAAYARYTADLQLVWVRA